MKLTLAKVIKALNHHHGGFNYESDQQVWILWDSIDPATKEKYLKPHKQNEESEVDNAVNF